MIEGALWHVGQDGAGYSGKAAFAFPADAVILAGVAAGHRMSQPAGWPTARLERNENLVTLRRDPVISSYLDMPAEVADLCGYLAYEPLDADAGASKGHRQCRDTMRRRSVRQREHTERDRLQLIWMSALPAIAATEIQATATAAAKLVASMASEVVRLPSRTDKTVLRHRLQQVRRATGIASGGARSGPSGRGCGRQADGHATAHPP